MNQSRCLLCGEMRLLNVSRFDLVGVTSDCKPWPRAGPLALCEVCGHVQKQIDDLWLLEVEKIYNRYEMYPLSSGAEQVVFDGPTPVSRTSKLLGRFRQIVDLPDKGRLLDIGCGNGAFLRTFKESFPKWRLFGFEQSDVFRKEVEGISGEGSFFSSTLDRIDGDFDLITMIYVIEHLPDPVGIMKKARALLVPGGILLIQTSHFLNNPFDLVVVDHCSHFLLNPLTYAAELAGFKVHLRPNDWIAKEIGLVAISTDESISNISPKTIEASVGDVVKALLWLNRVMGHARDVSGKGPIGIFGTAIAGTWLANALGGKVSFFVDEDPLRQGKTHMGLPVLKVSDVPPGSSVYLAFPKELAESLHRRLKPSYPYLRFITPPGLESE